MTARPRWRHPVSRGIGTEGTQLALDCARNVVSAIDRRSPEAGALAAWLAQHAMGFGLPEAALPGDAGGIGWARRGVSEQDWRMIHDALELAASHQSGEANAPAILWVAAIRDALELDSLGARILMLALHYKLDERIERLFDGLCECRGVAQFFQRDASLIALLLHACAFR